MKARNILLIGVILCVSLLVQLANREQAILHADISYGGGVPRTAIYFPYVIYSASPSFNTGLSIAGNTENIPPEETPQIWLYYYDEAGICYPCINNPIPVARGQNSQWTASMDMLSFVNLNKPPNGTLLALTNIPNAKPAACFFDMQTGVLSDITPIVDYSIIGVAQNGRIVRRPEYTPPRNLENPDDPTNFFNLAENQTSIDPALHHTTLFFPMCIHDLGYDTAFTITNSYDASGIGNRSASLYIYNKSGDLSRKIVVDMDSSGKAVSPSIIGVFSDLARTDISVLRNRAGIDSCEQYVPFSGQGWMMAVVNIPYAYGWSFIIRAGFVQGNATYPPTVDNNVWGVDSNWTPQRLVPSISDHTSIVVPFVPITQNFSTVVFFANTEKTASAAIHFSLYGMAGNLRKQWDYPTSGSLPCGNAATQSGFVYITNTGILVEEQPYDLPDVTDGWLLITIDSPNAYAVEFLAQVDAQHNYLCATNCIVDNNILGARPDGKIDRLIPLSPSAGNRFDVPLVLQGNPLPTFTATATANTCNQDDLISAGVTAVTYKYQGWTMPPAQTCYTTNPSPVSLNLTLATPRPPLAPSHFQVWDFMPGWGSGEEETSTQGTYQLRFHVLYVGSTVVDNMCASTADGYLMRGFRLDLDIDSDNDNGYDPPGRTVVEENIEGNAPGKVLVINDRDQDGDDVPDYADGFNLNGSEGDVDADDMNAQEKFVPLVLELPPGIDLDRILILFYYDASDPAGVNQEDYTPAPGALRVWEKDGNVARNKNAINAAQEQNRGDYVPPSVYPPAQLGFGEQDRTITLYVEGIAPITEHPFIYVRLYVVGEDIGPDMVRVSTVSPYDVDIDSDNNNGYDMPERSQTEEDAEETAPGKIICVNDEDNDNDGIPGFADGFNWDGQAGNDDDGTSGENFTPLIIELPHSTDVNVAKIRFTYEASNPADVTREGTSPDFTYTPASGRLRIWTKDADQERNKASVAAETPGHYVPSDTFDTSDLEWDHGKIKLFVEGVAPSATLGGNSILVEVDPDGDGPSGYVLADTVLVTVVNIDVDVDTDNNNDVADPDRNLIEDQREYFQKLDGTWTGKVMLANDGDVNNNFVPDFADFDAINTHKFTPLVLEIPAPIDLTKAKVMISYYSSEPDGPEGVVIDDETPYETEYTPGPGLVRIWTKNADAIRNKASIAAAAPGDYVPEYVASENNVYTPAQLGFAGATRQVTLFIEGVNPSDSGADTEIVVYIDPDGDEPAGYMAVDALRVTVMKIDLDAVNSIEPTEEVPGTGVLLNDDWDNGHTWDAAHLPDHREKEPIWDNLYTDSQVASENDLMKMTVRFSPDTLAGNVTLKIAAGAPKVRLWPQASKGVPGDIITIPGGGKQYAISDLANAPAQIFVEGIQPGRTEFTLEYTVGTKTYLEKNNVDVVTLHEDQGGVRKVINTYDSNIHFDVQPANPSPAGKATYLWNLDGNGTPNQGTWEDDTTVSAEVKYSAGANGADNVELPRTIANHRKTYDESVKLKSGFIGGGPRRLIGGLVIHKTIRVALDGFQGTALAAVADNDRQTELITLIPGWNNAFPVAFDNTDVGTNRTQASFNADYDSPPYTIGALNAGNRLFYSPNARPYAAEIAGGTGADIRIYCVTVAPLSWTSDIKTSGLSSMVAHEQRHCEQDKAAFDNRANPTNNVWSALDARYVGVVSDGYVAFAEADAHFTELLHNDLGWWYDIDGTSALELFRNRYGVPDPVTGAVNNGAVGRVDGGELAGDTKTLARTLLQQQIYENLPFIEMKRSDYDFYVRPPK